MACNNYFDKLNRSTKWHQRELAVILGKVIIQHKGRRCHGS
uniref:Uncharacterized protein n=1 Tax=Rhizophora mucronata TaxID=61149 RepID=A0A2P2P0G9_RHIMU